MAKQPHTLPGAVWRPLNWALAGLVLFAGAFICWAVFAPLATTLRLSGALISETPSFEVQHPYGGPIADIFVRQHSPVQKGDPLLRLDTELDQHNLKTFLDMHARITAENEIIVQLLDEEPLLTHQRDTHLALRLDQARLQSMLRQDAAKNLERQSATLRDVISHQTVQLEQMQKRANRLQTLIDGELMSQSNGEILQEQIQLVSSEISSQQARLIALEDQKKQAIGQAKLVLLSAREELAATLERNLQQLEELEPQIANLKDVIKRSTLHAPIDGVITELYYEASGMYAGRGQTLMSLAQPLTKPVITFTIPTHLIDQLRVGMTGKLNLPALSQRHMPDVSVTLTSISPRAELDENARPLFFDGRAELALEGIDALHQAVGEEFALSADMPVELLIEGRQITFAQYLLAPLKAAFRSGLQD